MKLKNSLRAYFALYFIALLFCLSARIWLKFNAMDYQTGFYAPGGALIASVFNAVLALCVSALFLLYLLRRSDRDYPVLRGSKAVSLLALITGVSIALYQLESLKAPGFGILNPGAALSGIPLITCAVLGEISAVIFIALGIRGLLRRNKTQDGILTLAAGVWQLASLVCKFNGYSTLTTISDNLFTVMFMMFGAMFLVGHARTLSGMGRKDGRNYVIPTGLSASLFGLLLVIPNWIWMAVNQTLILPAPLLGGFESLFVFFMSVYAFLFALHTCLSIRSV